MIYQQPLWFWVLAVICVVTLTVMEIRTRRSARRKIADGAGEAKP